MRTGFEGVMANLESLLAAAAEGPTPDAETSAALAVAGVSQAVFRLTGDTFQQFKGEYRKMAKPQRVQMLAQLQMRIAAIYAIENEDVQRQVRMEQQEKRHRQIDQTRRQSTTVAEKRARRTSAMMVEDEGDDEGRTLPSSSPARRRQGGVVQQDAQGLQLDQGQMGDGQHLMGGQTQQDEVDSFIHGNAIRHPIF